MTGVKKASDVSLQIPWHGFKHRNGNRLALLERVMHTNEKNMCNALTKRKNADVSEIYILITEK